MDDYDTTSMDAGNMSESAFNMSSRVKRERTFCSICGAKATGINFDVLTVGRDPLLFLQCTSSSIAFSARRAKRSFDETALNHW